jgi:microcystin-dependent protein
MTGTLPVNFKLYNQAEGGTALWESGYENIQFSSGIFSYTIRPNETRVDWKNKNIWLEVVVDGKELKPREKLMSVPYSLHSQSTEKLSANNEIEVEVNGNKVYVGIDNKKLYFKPSRDAEIEYLGVPAGTIIAFAGNNPPRGYLPCDGRDVEVSRYPDLFAAIGTIYGGNASSRFKLPDLRGVFLRGTGGNAAVLGQKQGDAIRNISGMISSDVAGANGVFVGASGAFERVGATNRKVPSVNDDWSGTSRDVSFSAANVVPIANENRPVNYAVNYCIKY